jgi:UTP-glucose-1-phosphate uridylyltransferase
MKKSTSALVSSLYSNTVKAAVMGVAAFGKIFLPPNTKAFKRELLPALTLPTIPIFKVRPSSSISEMAFEVHHFLK